METAIWKAFQNHFSTRTCLQHPLPFLTTYRTGAPRGIIATMDERTKLQGRLYGFALLALCITALAIAGKVPADKALVALIALLVPSPLTNIFIRPEGKPEATPALPPSTN